MNKTVYVYFKVPDFLDSHQMYINIREIIRTEISLTIVNSDRKAYRFNNNELLAVYVSTEK